jgi:hypothetical protein
MGAEGAALASTIAIGYGLVMAKIYTRKLTGTKWNPRIFIHIGAAIVMGIILFYITQAITIERWYEIGGMCLLGFGIYITLLWILREFKKEDYKLFMDIINPKGMGRYVVDELRGKNENNTEDGISDKIDEEEDENNEKEL